MQRNKLCFDDLSQLEQQYYSESLSFFNHEPQPVPQRSVSLDAIEKFVIEDNNTLVASFKKPIKGDMHCDASQLTAITSLIDLLRKRGLIANECIPINGYYTRDVESDDAIQSSCNSQLTLRTITIEKQQFTCQFSTPCNRERLEKITTLVFEHLTANQNHYQPY